MRASVVIRQLQDPERPARQGGLAAVAGGGGGGGGGGRQGGRHAARVRAARDRRAGRGRHRPVAGGRWNGRGGRATGCRNSRRTRRQRRAEVCDNKTMMTDTARNIMFSYGGLRFVSYKFSLFLSSHDFYHRGTIRKQTCHKEGSYVDLRSVRRKILSHGKLYGFFTFSRLKGNTCPLCPPSPYANRVIMNKTHVYSASTTTRRTPIIRHN